MNGKRLSSKAYLNALNTYYKSITERQYAPNTNKTRATNRTKPKKR